MASNGQPDRSALTLPQLSQASTTLVPVNPRFLQTLSDTLGDHLTPGDGFDALLNDPLTSIDSDSASVDSLGSVAPDVAALPGNFTPDALSAIAQDLATFNSNGDTILGTTGSDVAPPTSAPVTTAGEPTSPGAGGADGDKQPPEDNGSGIGWTDWGDVLDSVL